MRPSFLPFAVLIAVAVYGVCGCNHTETTSKDGATSNVAAQGEEDTHDHGIEGVSNEEIEASLSELPPDDRTMAESQRICPVTGEPLGSMGVPIKIDVKGQPVFICCVGCKRKLLAKPDEYLAKLKIHEGQL